MIGQSDPVDPGPVVQRVDEVMSRPEFQYDKSWLDRFGDWISEQLDKLFGGPVESGTPGAGASFGGGAGSLVAWLIIVIALAAVVAAIVYVVLHRVRRADDDDEPATTSEIEHRRSARAWRSEAEEHEAAGEWKAALRARYRELIRTLVDRRQLPDVAGRTTGELRTDLDATTPDASEPFDTLSLLFELAWYADVATGPEQNAQFRSAATQVLDAEVRSTSSEGSTGDGESTVTVEVG